MRIATKSTPLLLLRQLKLARIVNGKSRLNPHGTPN
jgi:hypothetical protein